MITISFFQSPEDDKFTGFECSGHSGYSEAGSDIVCAAVSVLTYNFVASLEKLLKIEAETVAREEDAYLKVNVKEFANDDVQLLFRSLHLGLKEIEKSYKKNVKLTNRRCKP